MTRPSRLTSRPDSPSPVSRSAPAPCTSAAVLAALASAQVAAATVTVRQGERTGRPVRGVDDVVEGSAAAATAAVRCAPLRTDAAAPRSLVLKAVPLRSDAVSRPTVEERPE
nr:hypothetical protein [Streptomyces viridochromogenes]